MKSLLFYLISFLIIIIVTKIFDINIKKNNKLFSIILFILILFMLTFISGFRYYVGTDYHAYIQMYNSYSYLEFGSVILFKIANLLSPNPQTIIFIYSLVTNLVILFSMYRFRNKCDISLSMATYLFMFFPFTFNIIRQSLAFSICLLAITYLLDKNYKRYIILVLVASLFHSSALIILPFIIVPLNSKNNKNIIKYIIFTILLIISILLCYKFFSNISIFRKYLGYYATVSFSNLQFIGLISYVPFIILILFFYKSIKKDYYLSSLSGLFISGILLEFLFSSSEVSRSGLYLLVSNMLLMPSLFYNVKNRFSKAVLNFLYITFMAVYFILVFYLYGRAEIFPYNNIYFLI